MYKRERITFPSYFSKLQIALLEMYLFILAWQMFKELTNYKIWKVKNNKFLEML
jgi:hypothetical protein